VEFLLEADRRVGDFGHSPAQSLPASLFGTDLHNAELHAIAIIAAHQGGLPFSQVPAGDRNRLLAWFSANWNTVGSIIPRIRLYNDTRVKIWPSALSDSERNQ
jgi:hypothetical protein